MDSNDTTKRFNLGSIESLKSIKRHCKLWFTTLNRAKSNTFRVKLLPIVGVLVLCSIYTIEIEASDDATSNWLVEVQRGDLPRFIASLGRFGEQRKGFCIRDILP